MKKILIVDDMTGVRRSLSVILTGIGHEVLEAENGIEGLKKLKANDEIALVITDILMPVSDGIELLTEIHKLENRPKLIAISGGGNKVAADNALEVAKKYADVILKKPFQRDEILKEVDTLLSEA